MRIAEVSRRSGVGVPTIKYYLREGLLPPGELTSPSQASYDEHHLRQLRAGGQQHPPSGILTS